MKNINKIPYVTTGGEYDFFLSQTAKSFENQPRDILKLPCIEYDNASVNEVSVLPECTYNFGCAIYRAQGYK